MAGINRDTPGNSYFFGDGRPMPTTNICPGNIPVMADILLLCQGNNWAGGWYHGGGYAYQGGAGQMDQFYLGPSSMKVIDTSVASGYNNSACNTLFAGGYVVHSDPSDFQDQNGTIDPLKGTVCNSDNAQYWFALHPTTK
jgi:hypothetical protein